jgi:hypothetical protein
MPMHSRIYFRLGDDMSITVKCSNSRGFGMFDQVGHVLFRDVLAWVRFSYNITTSG